MNGDDMAMMMGGSGRMPRQAGRGRRPSGGVMPMGGGAVTMTNVPMKGTMPGRRHRHSMRMRRSRRM